MIPFLLPLLRQFWPYLLIAGLVVSNAVTWHLYRGEVHEFDAYRYATEASAALAEQEYEAVVERQKRVTRETENGWKAALDYVRAHPPRVQSLPADASGQAGISVSASGLDGAGAYPISAAGELAADCAETTLKLNWLQNWAERQQSQ